MGDRFALVLAGLLVAGAAFAGALAMRDADPVAEPPPAPVVTQAAQAYIMVPALERTRGELPEVAGTATVCIDREGRVTSVAMPHELSDADRATATARLSSWLFAPYRQDGTAVPACTLIELGAPPAVVAEAPPVVCDEVSCVLDNYTGPCCAQYRKGSIGPAESIITLGRAEISSAMAVVKPHVLRCGAETGGTGIVKVRAKVAPDGTMRSVTSTRDDALARCVVAAVKRAHFPISTDGVSFGYPFVF